MKIEVKSALLVIDIQQEDCVEMNDSNMDLEILLKGLHKKIL